ncbi:phosphotransferase enzyme family protein [Paenibacillus lautus]|uniref:phosphotransferase enzyme family protein n=1 Tax=Paenibacillus lautus TaxID=1401 RepID=UPI001FEAD653|nr:phosphotransferase [Paenibacillus lautus]
MQNEQLQKILNEYGIRKPEITFIRHNENRTYKVEDHDGSTYLLRIHQPVKDGMAGQQHTYDGLLGELQMLEHLSGRDHLLVQRPLRNREGKLITIIEHEGKRWNSSMLTWLEGRDLQKDDLSDPVMVEKLGASIQSCTNSMVSTCRRAWMSVRVRGLLTHAASWCTGAEVHQRYRRL